MSIAMISHTCRWHRPTARSGLGLALLLLASIGAAAHADVCRVTTSGGGDGTTWASPMGLQTALKGNSDCDEIWVAAGVYMPGSAQSDTFTVPAKTAVYGGFAGNETARSQRDPAAHPTILSGDIDHNDSNADSNNIAETTSDIQGDNSYHVVYLDGAQGTPITGDTVLDGFTITAGHADGELYPDYVGGGLYCDGRGGGRVCSPSINHVTFSGNGADYDGGAMDNDGHNGGTSSPSLSNIIFSGNSADSHGGAMYNNGFIGTSNPSLSNVTFSGNRARYGSAMYNAGGGRGTSSPSLSNVTFSGNNADNRGGAMYNDGSGRGTSSPILNNVTFSGNSANYGGAMLNDGHNGGTSIPNLSNVTFSDNIAVYGGAIFNDGHNGTSSPRLNNVTFSGNSANAGGALYNAGYGSGISSPSLSNVIAWGNTASSGPEIYNSDSSGGVATPTIEHSVIQGSGGSGGSWDADLGIDAGGNLDADPNLGSLGDNGGFTHTMLPQVGSSAINATPCSESPAADQRGAPRPDPGSIGLPFRCDIGAVEANSPAGDVIFANGFD